MSLWEEELKTSLNACCATLRELHMEPWQDQHISWLLEKDARVALIATDPRIDYSLRADLISVFKRKP
ncbi:MAG: hypothetical protein HN790_05550 [Methylococcales bacterium]|jgi:hypothetical protein|nr:hypothetical protein [Methylococcales bacterium]